MTGMAICDMRGVVLQPLSCIPPFAEVERTPVDWDGFLYRGLDFWNDPGRWDDIDDPQRVKFWMKVYYPEVEPMRQRLRAAVRRERDSTL